MPDTAHLQAHITTATLENQLHQPATAMPAPAHLQTHIATAILHSWLAAATKGADLDG